MFDPPRPASPRGRSNGSHLGQFPLLPPLFAAPASRGFKIGACDWSLGKRGDPHALDVAKNIGLDGVQIDFGTARQPHAAPHARASTGLSRGDASGPGWWFPPWRCAR